MQEGVEITRRLWRAAQLRRLPLWVGGALPWLAIPSGPGLLAWAGWCAWDWAKLRRRVAFEWPAWIDAAVPEMEDSAALLAQADSPIARLQQQRLFARLDAALSKQQLRQIAGQRIGFGVPVLAISALLAGLTWWATQPTSAPASATPAAPVGAVPTVAPGSLSLRLAPPAYTGVAPSSSKPADLQVPQHTLVSWCASGDQAQRIELGNGEQLSAGSHCASWKASESIVWRWRGERYTLRVTPDQAPEITITAPTELVQDLREGATSIGMAVQVRDDYAIRRATLHMTLARGSGENVKFTEREMPLPASNNPKQRDWSRQWTLAELELEPGDELYFFVRAVDNAERAQSTQSATYVVRVPALEDEEEGDDTATMPSQVKQQSLRSQRQIIIDTEQLIADMRSRKMHASDVRDRSERIADDQATLRRRYGQFLGEESTLFGEEAPRSPVADDDAHHEHDGHDHGPASSGVNGSAESILAQYGHAHDESENATLYDDKTKEVLRNALKAMWDAEKALRSIAPAQALAPENKALLAIKELQQAERVHLHKTAFTPPPIKEEKRMSGDMAGSVSYRRVQDGSHSLVPEDMATLVQALSSNGALPALWTRSANDWVSSRIKDDEARLKAQAAIQDVADGCLACRPVLRAWLREGAGSGQVLLQARSRVETPYLRRWQEESKP